MSSVTHVPLQVLDTPVEHMTHTINTAAFTCIRSSATGDTRLCYNTVDAYG